MVKDALSRRAPALRVECSALLVIDMQKFFLDPKSPAHFSAALTLLPTIRDLVAGARAAGRPVAYSAYATSSDSPMSRWWRKTCPPNSPWCELGGGLKPRAGELQFQKSRYSAFRDTPLDSWLREQRIRDLVVAGVMTHLCVEGTVRDAFEAGYRVFVPTDGCAAADPVLHVGSLRTMAAGFAHVTARSPYLAEPLQ